MNNVDAKEITVDSRQWKKWGLTHNPFELQPNDKLFLTAESEEYLDLLPQFARFCNTLLIICGDQGKTALVQQFVQSQLIDTQVLSIRAEECPTVTTLLQLLHQRYNAPYDAESNETDTAKLDIQIQYLLDHRESRLLVIDDAETLSLSMRQACLQIVQQQSVINTCLPVMLVGTQTIVEQMNALLTPTTAQECLHILRMQPFDRKQTEEYCRFTWQEAGGERQHFLFSDDELDQIHFNSRGVLSDINVIAPALLVQNHQARSFNFVKSKLMWWIFAIVGIAMVLFFYHVFMQQTDNTLTVITKPNVDSVSVVNPSTTAPVTTTAATTKPATITPPPAQPVAPTAIPKPVGNQTSTAPAISSAANSYAPSSLEESTQQDLNEAQSMANQDVANEAVGAEVAPPAATTPAVPTATIAATPKKPIKQKMINANTQSAKLVMANKQDNLFKSVMNQRIRAYHDRVRKIKPTDYTLQLMASENLKAVQAFVLKYQLQETTFILRTNNKGKAWYVVVFGVFHNQTAAKNAVKTLPPALASSKLWARNYGGLQQILLDKE